MARMSLESRSTESNRWQQEDYIHLIECCAKNITKLERINTWRNIATEMTAVRKKFFHGMECKREWECLKRLYDSWKHFEDNRARFEKYFILMHKIFCQRKDIKPPSTLYRSASVASTSFTSSSCSKSSVVLTKSPQTCKSKVGSSPFHEEEGAASSPIRYEKHEEHLPKIEDIDLEASIEIKHKEQMAKDKDIDMEAARERRHKEQMDKADEFLNLFRKIVFFMSKDNTLNSSSSPSLTTDL